jgi:hypothetical protein
MHQRLHGTCHKAVVHEDVFVNIETGVPTLEITRVVTDDPVAQRQVLRTRRCTDGVGLYEAQSIERSFQRRLREETPRDRGAPKIVQRHSASLSTRFDGRDRLLKRLGRHSTGGGCLYVKRLSDVDLPTLKKIIAAPVRCAKKASLAS